MSAFVTMWLGRTVSRMALCLVEPRCKHLLQHQVDVFIHENVPGFPESMLSNLLGSSLAFVRGLLCLQHCCKPELLIARIVVYRYSFRDAAARWSVSAERGGAARPSSCGRFSGI